MRVPRAARADRPWEQGIWDRGLQPERTTLAWQRTALSAAACSLVIARLVGHADVALGMLVAGAAIVCGAMIAWSARRRHRRSSAAVHADQVLPDAKAYLWMGGLIVVAGIGAIGVALWFPV